MLDNSSYFLWIQCEGKLMHTSTLKHNQSRIPKVLKFSQGCLFSRLYSNIFFPIIFSLYPFTTLFIHHSHPYIMFISSDCCYFPPPSMSVVICNLGSSVFEQEVISLNTFFADFRHFFLSKFLYG